MFLLTKDDNGDGDDSNDDYNDINYYLITK